MASAHLLVFPNLSALYGSLLQQLWIAAEPPQLRQRTHLDHLIYLSLFRLVCL